MDKRLFSGVIALVVGFFLLIVLGEPAFNHIKETEERVEVEDSIYEGEIVDKHIENAQHGLFTSSDTEYRIYIEFEYMTGDGKKTGEKYFSVDRETYRSYDIGDWFNSHTL